MPELTRLGKYELRRVLGKGAMGIVYEGFDPLVERIVAIKVIRPDQLSEEMDVQLRVRLRREAQAAGRLNHPSIVTMYEYDESPRIGDEETGVAYIVMEFVKGRELKEFFDANEMFALPDVVRIMTEMLAGLQHAHEKGVTHRDIKPANVIILDNGHVKVADFGIARIDQSAFTQAGSVLGTPAYMAPEQIIGEQVDGRADIFAAGVILYLFLTGEAPFSGSFATIVQKVLNLEPLAPTMLNPSLSKAWDSVVRRAMAKKVANRYQTAADFSEAVEAASRGDDFEATLFGDATRIIAPPGTVFAPAAPVVAAAASATIPAPAPVARAPAPQPAPQTVFMTRQLGIAATATTPVNSDATVLPNNQTLPGVPPAVDEAAMRRYGPKAVEKSSGRPVLIGVVALAALLGGGYGAYVMVNKGKSPPLAAPANPGPASAQDSAAALSAQAASAAASATLVPPPVVIAVAPASVAVKPAPAVVKPPPAAPKPSPAPAAVVQSAEQLERQAWDDATRTDTLSGYEAFLRAQPAGRFAGYAKTRIEGMNDFKNRTDAIAKQRAAALAAARAALPSAPSPVAPPVTQGRPVAPSYAPPPSEQLTVNVPSPAAPPPAAVPTPAAPAARLPLVGIKRDRPVVTAELLREKQSGLVTVAFDVNPDGSTSNVRVASSSNRKLNGVAMEAVRQWRYQPINDVRATSVELEFKLD